LVAIVSFGNVQLNAKTEPLTTTIGTDEVLDSADVMPEFKGGTQGLMSFLASEVKYPEQAKLNNESGMVYISFVINSKGKVINPEILRGVSELLDQETIRVVSTMPDWTPGKNDNKNVNVKMVLPIKFALK
jgi:TonB family protein